MPNDGQAIHRKNTELHRNEMEEEKIEEHRKRILGKTSFWENYLMNAVYNFSLDIQMIVCSIASPHVTSKREKERQKKTRLML